MMRSKARGLGFTREVKIPEECGFNGYYAICTYKYIPDKEKYRLSMHIRTNKYSDSYKIDTQNIDTQYISGTRENIQSNIDRIVEHAAISGFFTSYIQKYEYLHECMKLGEEIMRGKGEGVS